MRRQLGMGFAAAVAALLLLLVAMWALSPSVPERARPPRQTAAMVPHVEPPPRPMATPRDGRTGRGNTEPTKPGERAYKPETPPPPYLLPILDDLTPGGPPTSPEAMKTPEGRAASKLQVAWGGIGQGMSDKANFIPDATQLEADAFAIADEYRKLRRGESVDFNALQQRQQALLDKMESTDGLLDDNPAYDDGVAKLRAQLLAYQRDKKASQK